MAPNPKLVKGWHTTSGKPHTWSHMTGHNQNAGALKNTVYRFPLGHVESMYVKPKLNSCLDLYPILKGYLIVYVQKIPKF